jgi:hypothetical protein
MELMEALSGCAVDSEIKVVEGIWVTHVLVGAPVSKHRLSDFESRH